MNILFDISILAYLFPIKLQVKLRIIKCSQLPRLCLTGDFRTLTIMCYGKID